MYCNVAGARPLYAILRTNRNGIGANNWTQNENKKRLVRSIGTLQSQNTSKNVLLTECVPGVLHRRSPCRTRAGAACKPETGPLLPCNFCPCWCRSSIAIDGMERDSVTSAEKFEKS